MKNTDVKQKRISEVATVNHKNHRQRLLNTISEIGLEHSNDVIALEFILTFVLPRVDTNPIAHRLLDKFGSISAVLDASVPEIKTVRGMGEHSAKLLTMLPHIFSRYNFDKTKNHKLLNTKGSMIQYCASLLHNKTNEEVFAVCLNKNYKVVAIKMIARGAVNEVSVDITEFLRVLLVTTNAYYVVLTHCHPDGNCKPSAIDVTSTEKIKNFISAVGLKLLDHIVVGRDKCYAILEGRFYDF